VELGRQRDQLSDELRALELKLGADAPSLKVKRVEMESLTIEMEKTKARLAQRLEQLATQERGAATMLLRPVAVRLENSSVRQAAEALTQATKINVRVDPGVLEETRLTLDARGVTLGAVLEAIARPANLKLIPFEGGVLLTTWPMVQVNGEQRVFQGPWAPWSTEWGRLPGHQSGTGWVFPGEPDGTAPARTGIGGSFGSPLGMPGGGAPAATTGYPGMNRNDPFGRERSSLAGAGAVAGSLASVGDRLVALAEPGVNPAGQPGVWITVYKLEGAQLKKLATAFHVLKSASSGGLTPGMGMMSPGGLGTPPGGGPTGSGLGAPMAPGGGTPTGSGRGGGLGAPGLGGLAPGASPGGGGLGGRLPQTAKPKPAPKK